MKLYLVRHGQSKRNSGKADDFDTGLSEIGEEQARRIGKFFVRKKIDQVYCSPLRRAKDTLAEIRPFIPGIKVLITKSIVEFDMGVFGKEGKDDWGGLFKAASNAGKRPVEFVPKGGESLQQVYDRAGKFYRRLVKNHAQKNILMVGHGIFSMYLIMNALGIPVEDGKHYSLGNASVSTLEVDGKGKVKGYWINDYHHLLEGGMR
jgi:broad specificity phosphatase PhoE